MKLCGACSGRDEVSGPGGGLAWVQESVTAWQVAQCCSEFSAPIPSLRPKCNGTFWAITVLLFNLSAWALSPRPCSLHPRYSGAQPTCSLQRKAAKEAQVGLWIN